MPTPHMTWVVCQELNSEQAVHLLSDIQSQTNQISTNTSGLGLFSGLKPVLYLPVAKTMELQDFHRTIWDMLTPMAINCNVFYSPEEWIPHITIAINDLTKDKLACAINCLASDDLRIDIKLDNLSIAEFEEETAAEIISQIKFADQKEEYRDV